MRSACLREACRTDQTPHAMPKTPEHPGIGDPHVEGQEVEDPSRSPIELPALLVVLQPRHIEDGIRNAFRVSG